MLLKFNTFRLYYMTNYCASIMHKWGVQVKTAKRKIRNYMTLESWGTK